MKPSDDNFQLITIESSIQQNSKPILRTELIEKIRKNLQFKPKLNIQIKKCYKCNTELQAYTRQTRSADEGMTTFYKCPTCNTMKRI